MSGFVGLFFVTLLALVGAVVLRVLRLSAGATPYLVAAIILFGTIAVSAFWEAASFYAGFGGYSPVGAFIVSFWTLILVPALPFAMGLIRPLRRDGWAGLIGRVFALAATLAIAGLVYGMCRAAYESSAPMDGGAWVQYALPLAAATPLYVLVMWPVWVFFDRIIIRGNCAPKRFA
jgi:hypothetical protein